MKEVRDALFQMKPWKALGPDGYHAGFFHKHWSLVGKQVFEEINRIWMGGSLEQSLKGNLIALIPKITAPTTMVYFRPISLSSVFYKIVTKVLANRTKPILPYVIDHA